MIFKLCRRCKRTILHPSIYCIKCLDAVNQEREKLKSIRESKYNKNRDPKYKAFYNRSSEKNNKKYDLNIKAIGYDPHNADDFLSDLEELGVSLLEVTQFAKFLNDTTVDMQLNVKSGIVEYNKHNELLSWSFSNDKVVANSFGEIKVDKEPGARTKRIDPVDAVIDAHVTCMKFKEDIDIEKEMTNYLQAMGRHEE